MKHNIGERIGAIQSATSTEVIMYGYGVYAGEEIPPSGFAHICGHTNPKLVLDNGKTVWGQECWWGSEEAVKTMIGERKIVNVLSQEETK